MNNNFTLYCCGSRGLWPVDGHSFNEYGGNTSCYVLKSKDYAVVIDCGTGLYQATSLLVGCKKVDILFTHMHYDHVLGLMAWQELPNNQVTTFYGNFNKWFNEKSLAEFFRTPFWPIVPNLTVENIPEDGKELILSEGLTAKFYASSHPNDSKIIVIEYANKKLVAMFDNELLTNLDYELVNGANILLYDGMYSDDEYPKRKGYGHSTWKTGVEFAKKCNVDLLVITHHDPHHTDTLLNNFEYEAKKAFPNTIFARSGNSWSFPYAKDKREIEDYFEFNLYTFIKDKYQKLVERIAHTNIKNYYKIYLTNILLGSFAIIMTIFDMQFAKNIPYVAFFIAGAAFMVNAIILKINKKSIKFIYYLFMVECMVAVMFLFYISGPTPFGFAWLILFPVCGMLVFGRKHATIDCGIILVALVVFLNSSYGSTFLVDAVLTSNYNIKYPLLFINFTIICFIVETVRNQYVKRLNETMDAQEETISKQVQELRDQNYALLEYNAKTQMRNDLLNKTFGKFLPDDVIMQQINNNDTLIKSRKEEVTVLRCGIRNFRTITASMDSSQTIDFLNHYFEEMTEIIHSNGGVTLEYVGDSIMAIFQGDNQAENSIIASINMMNNMSKVNKYNQDNNYPNFAVGIALHTGDAVLGVIGSENHMKYSAVGSAVNTAASIEHRANKHEILISENTKSLLNSPIHYTNTYSFNIAGLNEGINAYAVDGIGYPYNISVKYEH